MQDSVDRQVETLAAWTEGYDQSQKALNQPSDDDEQEMAMRTAVGYRPSAISHDNIFLPPSRKPKAESR
jgi:hypothetical protein